ncbi:MAG: PilZ domain-containing protein [Acidobacteriota bacterium]
MSKENRRGFRRLRLPFKGKAIFSSHGEKIVEARDISAGSAYLIADTCLDLGDEVKLRMRWPDGSDDPFVILDAEGTVFRVEQISENAWGCVVKFTEMPDLAWKK